MLKRLSVPFVILVVLGLGAINKDSERAIGGQGVACNVTIGPQACGYVFLNNNGCNLFSVNVAQYTTTYTQFLAPTSTGDCSDNIGTNGSTCYWEPNVDVLLSYACTQNVPWVPGL